MWFISSVDFCDIGFYNKTTRWSGFGLSSLPSLPFLFSFSYFSVPVNTIGPRRHIVDVRSSCLYLTLPKIQPPLFLRLLVWEENGIFLRSNFTPILKFLNNFFEGFAPISLGACYFQYTRGVVSSGTQRLILDISYQPCSCQAWDQEWDQQYY